MTDERKRIIDILQQRLDGWKPKDLAKRTRYRIAEIRKIMSGDYDLDTEGIGELLCVLDTQVNFHIRA